MLFRYLYLLFDPDNFINGVTAGKGGLSGIPHRVASRTCLLDTGTYIFNTEAHPFDAGALDCCYGPTERDIWQQAWFPKPKPVDMLTTSTTTSPPEEKDENEDDRFDFCLPPTWQSVFGLGKIINKKSSSRKSTSSWSMLEKKVSPLYSLLTCKSESYLDRTLCIAGEVCNH